MIRDAIPHHRYAHNMSAPPRTTVSYQGLSALQEPGYSGAATSGSRVGLRLALPAKFPTLPARILGTLGQPRARDAAAALEALIEQHSTQLPIPDGCLVLPTRQSAEELIAAPLTTLAAITKSSEVVWLRGKLPRLERLNCLTAITLWLPVAAANELKEIIP